MQQVVVLGASGLVGSAVSCGWTDTFDIVAPSHAELDVLDPERLEAALSGSAAQVVLNLVAWADVDGAEAQRGDEDGLVFRLNAALPGRLATLCARHGKYLVHVSTDYVFDGDNDQRPYREGDPTGPLCWYAQTKLLGELAVRQEHSTACVARIEMPFTAHEHRKRDFARTCAARFERGELIVGVTDQRITPVLLDDAVRALGRLVEAQFSGTVHVAPTSWTTPFDFAQGIARRLGFDEGLVLPETFERFTKARAARRPRHSWLDVTLAQQVVGDGVLRPVDEQLDTWAARLRAL